MVRGERTDLLLYEIEDRDGGEPVRRLTWILEFDTGAPLQTPLEVASGGAPARGWLLEEIRGMPNHAAPLEGTLSVTQRTADTLGAVVNVFARVDPPTAGEAAGDRVRLARKIQYRRDVPATISAPELRTRGGQESVLD